MTSSKLATLLKMAMEIVGLLINQKERRFSIVFCFPWPEVTPRCHDFAQLSEIVSEIVPRFGDGHEWISRDRYRITVMIQWEFQDPKMEVLYHIRPCFVGIFPYIGLT
jgi:hypothetical protein